MERIVKWVMVVLLMAFVAGCATTNQDLSYDKVRKENPGLAGGLNDGRNPNWRN